MGLSEFKQGDRIIRKSKLVEADGLIDNSFTSDVSIVIEKKEYHIEILSMGLPNILPLEKWDDDNWVKWD